MTDHPIRIHGLNLSPPCRIVMIFCKLHNIPYELVVVDLTKGEHKSPEFLAINPYGQVPAITHGSFSLGECGAIIYYLAEAFHTDSQWFPSNPQLRAIINSSLHWHHTNTMKALTPYLFEKIVGPRFFGRPQITVEKEAEVTANLDAFLRRIDTIFESGVYIARTSSPTIADILLFSYLSQLEMENFDFGPYKSVRKWYGEIDSIPAVREVHEPLRQFIQNVS
ncbi:unnamed protein product [Blepharisma stoltei]|uniref:Glutathione S-transferase n=1 Tax=Blepharisma stoltei TaxID=1481888 RepID=A0AAU9ISU7_9CILI|nr:unnamed protein product [Blepharisma stoltei]